MSLESSFPQDVKKAEEFAAGTRGGVPVGPESPAYHNNSKYYHEQTAELFDGVAQENTAQSELDVLRAISAQLQTIIDQGGSAGDLNGFSLALGEGSTVIISYTDPDDETITGSATFPTNDTASEILTHITSVAQSLAIIAGKNEEV